MADEKIIFSMNGVSKILPHNNKVILKDIYLGFFYGAKIGILGLNGAGKSTLLKIIAGVILAIVYSSVLPKLLAFLRKKLNK